MKRMWFISMHEPTQEQVEDAKRMGYDELVWIKSPELQKNSDIEELWLQILNSNPIRPGDAIVLMGAPQWISWFIRMHQASLCFMDGYAFRPIFKNSLGEEVEYRQLRVYTTYTERKAVEERMPDGTVRKVSVFKHGGFIPI